MTDTVTGTDGTTSATTDVQGAAPAQPLWRRIVGRIRGENERISLKGDFESYPHLLAIKPREKYVFRSDYYQVDDQYAAIMAFVHSDTATDDFSAFWGIARIPYGLDERVTAIFLEQVRRMEPAWVDAQTRTAERVSNIDTAEATEAGTAVSRRQTAKRNIDLEVIVDELQNGASYLWAHDRLMLRAPELRVLDEAVEQIARSYVDNLGTLRAAPYAGAQRRELSTLLAPNVRKKGKGFYFTSTEFAGSYSLVTNGLNDPGGEYVGFMEGEVNNSAVLLDVNATYCDHVVIADSTKVPRFGDQRMSDAWCAKLSQACLLDNGRVVHLILNDADLSKLGRPMAGITAHVDLNRGDINPFEMFGDEADELAVFATQMEKLKLMFSQLRTSADGAIESVIDGALEDVATDFYVEQRMWHHNAKQNRHLLRVVGIPHDQVPRLQMFATYLETARRTALADNSQSRNVLTAYDVLISIVNGMLSTNGDLFNNVTSASVDGVRDSRRVVYDFSRLRQRGKGVAMAQLVNIIGFAVGSLGPGDSVIIHGTDQIDARVKGFLAGQFDQLKLRGARVVFGYDDVDRMLADVEFNKFDAADYTLLGAMRDKAVDEYQRLLAQRIPPDLAQLVTRRGENLVYLRRGRHNIVFRPDLSLGVTEYERVEQAALEADRRDARRRSRTSGRRSDDRKSRRGVRR